MTYGFRLDPVIWWVVGFVIGGLSCETHLCVADDGLARRAQPQLEGGFLTPFLPGKGVPVAYSRDSWDEHHIEPFGEPLDTEDRPNLRVALWSDGTIIWGDEADPRGVNHYEGKIEVAQVRQLLSQIDIGRYRTANNVHYSRATLRLRYFPGTMIAFVKNTEGVFLYSLAEGMRRLDTYWYWGDNIFEEFPKDKYTYEEYRAAVPASFRQYMDDYDRLRKLLWSAIPKDGKRIVLHERILWVNMPFDVGSCFWRQDCVRFESTCHACADDSGHQRRRGAGHARPSCSRRHGCR
jgi:hypothetical protein